MKPRKRVVTTPGVRAPASKRSPTVRRIKPAIVAVRRSAPGAGGPLAAPPPPRDWEAATHDPVELSVEIGRGLVLPNPILVASGTFGYGVEHGDGVDVGRLGAVCTRGTTLRARSGNPPPRIREVPGGLLNSVGLQNPGIDAVIERYGPAWAAWRVPVIVNVAAESVGDYVEIVHRLEGAAGVAGFELNLSCPNQARGGLLFGLDAELAGSLVAAVRRATDLPIVAKLSPGAPDARPIARAIEDAGADALSAVNTLPGAAPGRLGSPYGGLSGPALKPLALRVVFEVAQAVDIPVIGVGGVTSLDDVLDFLAAGAVAVQVGTANFADPSLGVRLVEELIGECRARGLSSYRDLIGTALPKRMAQPSARGAEYRP